MRERGRRRGGEAPTPPLTHSHRARVPSFLPPSFPSPPFAAAPEILLGSTRYTKGVDMWAVGCILGETGLPAATIGRVQLFERHSLVDISATFESQILESLNQAAVKGRKLKAKIAAY